MLPSFARADDATGPCTALTVTGNGPLAPMRGGNIGSVVAPSEPPRRGSVLSSGVIGSPLGSRFSPLSVLLNAESLEVVDAAWQSEKGTPVRANSLGELFLPLTGLIDFAAERVRLTKEVEKIAAEIEKVQSKLANPSFAQKVPAKVLEEHQLRLADWQAKETQAKGSLANLPE